MSEFLKRIQGMPANRLALLASQLQVQLEQELGRASEPIAVIGLAGRYPGGCDTLEAFWNMLVDGRDAFKDTPSERWDMDLLHDEDPDAIGKIVNRRGSFIDDFDCFDADFFGIGAREAATMDPQHRVLLEVAWEALEDTGTSPAKWRGSRAGVFVAICTSDYADLLTRSDINWDGYLAQGTAHSLAAGRLSYLLGLEGPCLAVDTACSSSLVATHLACRSLQSGESDTALAGGVNLLMSPLVSIDFSRARLLSPSGYCRPFDAGADGYVRGEGCGMMVLKRLSDARRDGDSIRAVIRGCAVNHVGRGAMMSPKASAQETVIRAAAKAGQVNLADVAYLEASSVGTALGDPIEIEALRKTLCLDRGSERQLLLGSVKTNIGHLEASSGMAALTKVVLSLERGVIPPHLHLERLNPEVPWNELPIRIPVQPTAWPASPRPRLAAISSFSISGTNAHLILEQAPPPAPREVQAAGPMVLPISAKTEAALARLCRRFTEHLERAADADFASICYTAATGRVHHARRVAAVGASRQEAIRALASRAAGAAVRTPVVAFLFPQRSDVDPGLLHEFTRLDADGVVSSESADLTWFTAQCALTALWRRWGVEPAFVLGELGGECAAACAAGLFGHDAGAALIRARSGAGSVVQATAGLVFQPEKIRIVSGLSGGRTSRGELAERDYWIRQSGSLTRCAEGLAELRKAGVDLCVVMGFEPAPGAIPEGMRGVSALRRGQSLAQAVANGLAVLYESGVDVDWDAFHAGRAPARTSIPTYPFERNRFWPVAQSTYRAYAAPSAGAAIVAETAPAEDEPIERVVRRELARILDCDADAIDAQAPIAALGLDSLRALQLKDRLSYLLKTDLPVAELASSPTVAELIRFLGRQSKESVSMAEFPTIVPDTDGRHEAFALTDIQQAYWVGRQAGFELGGVSTHAYFEYQLGDLDIDRLERALCRVVDRHDMLRAVVLPSGRQVVLRDLPPYQVRTDDLRAVDPAGIEATLERIRRETSHEVRPADRWPLFEVRASLLPQGLTRLHVSVDLLIVDAWSIEILAREIGLLYGFPDAVLPPLDLRFRDCVLAQGALTNTEVYRRSERYWKDRIADLPPAPELPVARLATRGGSQEFVRRMSRLDAAAWTRLQLRARKAGVSPTVAVLTAFAHVLREWSKSPRFTINLTLFHRPPLHPQINDVVGDFTSLTLLESDMSGADPFEAKARQLQRQLWSDLDHRYFGGVRVLRELAMQTGRPAEALMPVVFTAALGLGTGVSGVLDGELIYAVSQTPQVWLDHQVLEDRGELVVIWDSVEALFPPRLLDDMFEAYTALLGRLASEERVWDDAVGCLTPLRELDARRALGGIDVPVSDALLHGLFAAQVRENADRTAVVAPGCTLSYAELSRRATAMAMRLRELGAAPNQLVAIVMEKGWEQVVAALAILESGAAYVPIDARTPHERLAYLLGHCAVDIVLTQEDFQATIDWPSRVKSVLSDFPDPGNPLAPMTPVQRPEDLAYVIFTSGSSGLPKGVMIDHRGAVNTILDVNRRFAVGRDDRTLALSSLSFDLSVWDIFGLLAAGGAIVLPDAGSIRDPAHWVDLLEAHRVTVWNSVPALMQLTIDYASSRSRTLPESLRTVMLSGDWVPVRLAGQARAASPRGKALNVYSLGGATEASIWSVFHPIAEADSALASIPYGRPLANQGLQVLDGQLHPRPDGVPGDLYIDGIGLAHGYWRDPALTAAAFFEHPRTGKRLYRTGDLARHFADGALEFLGREDSQVKIQGFRVELGEIEANLVRNPQVRHAVALVVGEGASRRLAACVVGVDGLSLDAQAMRADLASRVPDYMVPPAILVLDALPLTSNGKVDSREIRRLAESGSAARANGPEASGDDDPLTLQLFELVKTQLQIADLGVHTNLLQVGANSLDMLGLVNEVEQQLGFRPKVEEFFRRPSIAGLRELRRRYEANEEVADQGPLDDLGNIDLAELTEVSSSALVLDPRQREVLKRQSLEVRRFDATRTRVALPIAPPSIEELESFAARRSYREFDPRPVALDGLAATLGCLKRLVLEDKPKHLYGSAGGLYSVQTYLYVKADRVEGLPGGTYYFDPVGQELVCVRPGVVIPASTHIAYNQTYFAASAFSVFLIAETAALKPLYGELSDHLACVEAGLMSQLLELTGARQGVGFCQIGTIDFEGIRDLFELRSSHSLLHSLVGGRIADRELRLTSPEDAADVEEGTV